MHPWEGLLQRVLEAGWTCSAGAQRTCYVAGVSGGLPLPDSVAMRALAQTLGSLLQHTGTCVSTHTCCLDLLLFYTWCRQVALIKMPMLVRTEFTVLFTGATGLRESLSDTVISEACKQMRKAVRLSDRAALYM